MNVDAEKTASKNTNADLIGADKPTNTIAVVCYISVLFYKAVVEKAGTTDTEIEIDATQEKVGLASNNVLH